MNISLQFQIIPDLHLFCASFSYAHDACQNGRFYVTLHLLIDQLDLDTTPHHTTQHHSAEMSSWYAYACRQACKLLLYSYSM